MLKDEHQALQMLHGSLEEKMNKLQEDNIQLVTSYLSSRGYNKPILNSNGFSYNISFIKKD